MHHPFPWWLLLVLSYPASAAVWAFGIIGEGTAAQIVGLGITGAACLAALRVVSRGYRTSDEVTAAAVARLTAELERAYRRIAELEKDKPLDPETDNE